MKSRWINFSVELELSELIQSIGKRSFSVEQNFGFEVFSVENSFIEASYTEKVTRIEKFALPDGTEIENEQISIINFDFAVVQLQENKYLIEVVAAPRSINSFIDNLERTLSTPVFISVLQLKIDKLLHYLNEYDTISNVKINNISVGNLKIDENNFADIQIKSRKNILEALNNKFPNQDYLFKKAKVSFFYQHQNVSLVVTNKGAFDIVGEAREPLLKFLMNNLY